MQNEPDLLQRAERQAYCHTQFTVEIYSKRLPETLHQYSSSQPPRHSSISSRDKHPNQADNQLAMGLPQHQLLVQISWVFEEQAVSLLACPACAGSTVDVGIVASPCL